MKLLVVHADGLLSDSTAAAPSIDPIPTGVEYVRALTATLGYPLIMTFDGVNLNLFDAWLQAQGIRPMRCIPTGHLEPNARLEETLSNVGELHSVVGLYVSANAYDCRFMSAHGYPCLQFHEPQPDREGWGLEPGTTWGKMVPPEDEE